jgi:hypothetical protein
MISIYLDEVKPAFFYRAKEFCLDRLYYFDNLDIPHKIFTNLDDYLHNSTGKKVAVLHNNFTHCTVTAEFLTKFPKIREFSDLIFLVESENPDNNIEQYVNMDNVVYVLPGPIGDSELNKKIIFKPTWFEITTTLYKQLPEVLDRLTPYSSKPKFFDALFGVGRPHRDFVFDSLKKSNLVDVNIVNYHQKGGPNQQENTDFIIEPGTTRIRGGDTDSLKSVYSVEQVNYMGQQTHLACVIHTGIYNQTAYSIITETNCDNHFHLFTEKISKAIIGRRLFVVFAGQGYLQSLRNLGFKTFSNVIDESYDDEPDPKQRWEKAFDQVKFLCNLDQNDVLPKIKDIVDYNFKLLMETDWTGLAINEMIAKVKHLANST